MYKYCLFWSFALFVAIWGCQHSAPKVGPPEQDPFLVEKNALFNGDYYSSYPLHHPDSCLIKIKAEVPPHLQPWSCLAIWYRLPRNNPERSFRWLQLYEENYPHDTVFAFAQMMRGEFFVEMHQYDTAQSVLLDAKKRYLELKRPLDASDADYLMARRYNQENKTAEALSNYFKVLELLNQHDTTFSHRHISLYFDIATAYSRNKDNSNALLWLRKAQSGDSTKLTEPWKYHITIANHLSTQYAQIGRFDSSIIMANAAIALFQQHRKKPVPAELNYRLGFAYTKKGDYEQALPLLKKAESGSINSPNTFMKNQIEQALGEIYFDLGRMDSSEWYIRRSLSTPDTGNLAAAHQRLAVILARKGDYPSAYTEATKGITFFKRYFAIERATALADYEARYETAQKTQRIAELEAKQKISAQRSLIFGLFFLMGIGILLALFQRQRIKQQIIIQQHHILEQEKSLLFKEKGLAEALAKLKVQELEQSQAALENTQKELHSTTQILQLKDEFIEVLQMQLQQKDLSSQESGTASVSQHTPNLRHMKILTDNDWLLFRQRCDIHFPNLIDKLKSTHPTLSGAEVRLFLLTKLNFNLGEISEALGISKESIYRGRHRLSKKLKLKETANLDVYVQGF